MLKRHSWPRGHWSWPVDLSHQHGVRCGQFIFTGGQAALDPVGQVTDAENLERQVESVLDYVESILHDLGARFEHVVKLVCYFTGNETDESNILSLITQRIGLQVQPVINTICMPALCYPGMRIELEAVAMLACDGTALPRENIRVDSLMALHDGYSHIVRCDDTLFSGDVSAMTPSGEIEAAGDVVQQTQIMMDNLTALLAAAGSDSRDVLKLNVFYCGDGTAESWEKPAQIRATFFDDPGPAATGLAVQQFAQPGLMSKIFITAMRSKDGPAPKKHVWPEGHWDWTTPLPYKHGNRCGSLIHLGGQVSLDANSRVIDPDDMVAQTRRAMDNIRAVLAEFGANLDDVVKVSTFYQGDASANALHENLTIRSNSYATPGPATTGVPVPYLVYQHMVIEIEVIAMLDTAFNAGHHLQGQYEQISEEPS